MCESTEANGPSEAPGLLSVIKEDWRCNQRMWLRPGLHAVLVYRFQSWVEQHPHLWIAPVLRILGQRLASLIRVRYGIELHPSARIGPGLGIAHQGGIVIGAGVVIGDECGVRQGVKIGCYTSTSPGDCGAPRIGNRVTFGARAVVEGPVRIGDGAKIGPNSVVTQDIEPNVSAIAPPSRIIRQPVCGQARETGELPTG